MKAPTVLISLLAVALATPIADEGNISLLKRGNFKQRWVKTYMARCIEDAQKKSSDTILAQKYCSCGVEAITKYFNDTEIEEFINVLSKIDDELIKKVQTVVETGCSPKWA